MQEVYRNQSFRTGLDSAQCRAEIDELATSMLIIQAKANLDLIPLIILRKEVNNLYWELNENVTADDLKRVRASTRWEERFILCIPLKNVDEVHTTLDELQSIFFKKNSNVDWRRIMIRNERNNKTRLFFNSFNPPALAKFSKLLFHGTFENWAKYFANLFTIHVVRNNHLIFLIFVILFHVWFAKNVLCLD